MHLCSLKAAAAVRGAGPQETSGGGGGPAPGDHGPVCGAEPLPDDGVSLELTLARPASAAAHSLWCVRLSDRGERREQRAAFPG